MPWVISGVLLIVVIVLIVKYNKKLILDQAALEKYTHQVERLQVQQQDLKKDIKAQLNTIGEYNAQIADLKDQYAQESFKRTNELDEYFAAIKALRQTNLDEDIQNEEKTRREALELRMQQFTAQAQHRVNDAEIKAKEQIAEWEKAQQNIIKVTEQQEQRFSALLAPLKQYEMERQQRLFYTIQVPDEYKDDIEFLLTTVAPKVQHPDVINKLIWSEYVKPYLDETFKRVGIEAKSGIYKLTNIESGKAYIGKSTDIKKRIADHMKGAIGISTIADQAVHHEIARTGFWNWSIECIIYCEKEKLSELEKYYIDFFKTQEFGFNKNVGGGG